MERLTSEESEYYVSAFIGDSWQRVGSGTLPEGVPKRIVIYRRNELFVRAGSESLVARFEHEVVGPAIGEAFVVRIKDPEFDPLQFVIKTTGDPVGDRSQHPDPDPETPIAPVGIVHGFMTVADDFYQVHGFFFTENYAPEDMEPGAEVPADMIPEAQLNNPVTDALKIGVIDTGYDKSHPWFDSPLVTGQNRNDATWPGVHGTLVMGVLRQSAPGVPIHMVSPTLTPTGVVSEKDLIDLINDLDREDCMVLNMSFGSEVYTPTNAMGVLETRLQRWKDAGKVSVAPGGNRHGRPITPNIYPAAYPSVVAVSAGPATPGATGNPNTYYRWANGSVWTDAIAEIDVKGGSPNGDYHRWIHTAAPKSSGKRFAFTQGTSTVAPMIAGMIATGLWDPANPDLRPPNTPHKQGRV